VTAATLTDDARFKRCNAVIYGYATGTGDYTHEECEAAFDELRAMFPQKPRKVKPKSAKYVAIVAEALRRNPNRHRSTRRVTCKREGIFKCMDSCLTDRVVLARLFDVSTKYISVMACRWRAQRKAERS
jgi:hypothetical protein